MYLYYLTKTKTTTTYKTYMKKIKSLKTKMRTIKQQLREKCLYPFLGITLLATLIYFNIDLDFEFPIVLWQRNMAFVGVDDSTHFVIMERNDNNNNGRKMGGHHDRDYDHHQSKMYVNGWNSYWLLEPPSTEKVAIMFKKASQMGLNVCRTWAFSDGPGPRSLQISPGVFNDKALQALDYVIVEARKYGIRLILSLVNDLNVFGGKAQYVKWAQEAGVNVSSSADPFYEDSTIKGYYKNYVKAIIKRKNSISGVRYSEEPAIFAWELINEPRCESNSSTFILQAWITEMAAYIKSLDQNHMVTVGLEGFYGIKAVEKSEVNPGEWASVLGTDFIHNSAVDGIDFASVHLYPDSWMPHANETEKFNFISKWMDSHISDAENILKKPVVFTEVGCPSDAKGEIYNRHSLFKTVFDKIYESAKEGKAGAGAMIWQLFVEDMDEYEDGFSMVAWNQPAIYRLIVKQSCRLRSIFWKRKSIRELDSNDPCYGLVS